MNLSDAITEIRHQLSRAQLRRAAIFIGAGCSYAFLIGVILSFFSKPAAMYLSTLLLLLLGIIAWQKRIWRNVSLEETCTTLDSFLNSKNRALTYVSLASSNNVEDQSKREFIQRQLQDALHGADLNKLEQFKLSKAFRRVLWTLPFVWISIVCLGLFERKLAASSSKNTEVFLIEELLKDKKLPEAVHIDLKELASALRQHDLTDAAVAAALEKAEREIEEARAELDSGDLGAQGEQGEITQEVSDEKVAPEETLPIATPTPQVKKEEEKDTAKEQEKQEKDSKDQKKPDDADKSKDPRQGMSSGGSSSEKGSEKTENESKKSSGGQSGGGEGKSQKDQDTPKKSESGDGEGQGEGKEGKGDSQGKGSKAGGKDSKGESEGKQGDKDSGKEGSSQEGKAGEKDSSAKGDSGQSGDSKGAKGDENQKTSSEKNAEGNKQDSLNKAAAALSQVKEQIEKKQAEKQGSEGEQSAEEAKSAQGGGNSKNQQQKDGEKGDQNGSSGKKEEGKKGDMPNPQNSPNQPKGDSSLKVQDAERAEPPQNAPANQSSIGKEGETAKRFSEDGEKGEGLDGKTSFKEATIPGDKEKLDPRFTEKQGKLSQNPNQAKSKRELSDVLLSKPDASTDAASQPIPLEYKDLLE